MKSILIEGISRVGKSTIIRELSNRINLPVHKYQNPKSRKEVIELFSTYLMVLKNKTAIWDRGHISELVYGPLYRPNNYLDQVLFKLLFAIDRKLAQGNLAVIVYLWPLDRNLLDFTGREVYQSNVSRDLNRYLEVLSKSQLPRITMSTHEVVPGKIPGWKSPGNVVDHLLIKLRSNHEF